MKTFTSLSLCAGIWLLGAAGCSDESAPAALCAEGTRRDCQLPGGGVGEQVCSGGAYGVCQEPACTDGATLTCVQSSGQPGQKVCNGGVWTACGPIPGQCQDGTYMPCTTVEGAPGRKSCEGGSWSHCTPDQAPDCRDGDKQACSTACGTGSEICVNGTWQNCDAPKPSQEICDGYDNNCDGRIDEVCSCIHGRCEACYTGPEGTRDVGVCRAGQRCCNAGQWSDCVGQVLPASTEDCTDNLDNDCDGTVNNGCLCALGEQQPCGTDVGECETGQQTCQLVDGAPGWGACLGGVMPVAEEPFGCDGKDQNCDGLIDNGLPADDDEVNDTCGQARHKSVDDDGVEQTFSATVYPSGDVDYYRVSLNEVTVILLPDPCNPLCFPPFCDPSPQCLYLELEIVQPADATFEATVLTGGSCTSPKQTFSTTGKLSLQWDGLCNLDDSRDIWIKVAPKAGAAPDWSCHPYQLRLRHTKENKACSAS